MRKQAETAEIYLDKGCLTEAERVEKLPAERDASSARLHEVVATLLKIIRNGE